jgi:hypothetical protein
MPGETARAYVALLLFYEDGENRTAVCSLLVDRFAMVHDDEHRMMSQRIGSGTGAIRLHVVGPLERFGGKNVPINLMTALSRTARLPEPSYVMVPTMEIGPRPTIVPFSTNPYLPVREALEQ